MSDYDELLARLDREAKESGYPFTVWGRTNNDAAAAIRDLQAQLEAERKALEIANKSADDQMFQKRTAEAKLATYEPAAILAGAVMGSLHFSAPTKEALRIASDGRIYWNGREVESDEDFRAAMMAVANYLKASSINPGESWPTFMETPRASTEWSSAELIGGTENQLREELAAANAKLEHEREGYETAIAASYDASMWMEKYKAANAKLHAIKEIYTGMEGFIPESAVETYLQRIIKQMYEAAQ